MWKSSEELRKQRQLREARNQQTRTLTLAIKSHRYVAANNQSSSSKKPDGSLSSGSGSSSSKKPGGSLSSGSGSSSSKKPVTKVSSATGSASSNKNKEKER